MSYYKDVYNELISSPPVGWTLTHYGDGVYLWPEGVFFRMVRLYHQPASKLNRYQILFEFHRTSSGTARILARARCDDPNIVIWKSLEAHARSVSADLPKKVIHATDTRSVAKWKICGISANTSPKDSADEIRKFLHMPPASLTSFVAIL
jgi:hypothetical protein